MSGDVSDFGEPQSGGPYRPSDALETAICSGSSFGLYVLEELIGIGHTASVYRAHDSRLLRDVAIKVLNTEVLAGAEGLARFLHEARMAAAIRHPNVVSLLDVGAHDGKPYIVMELLTGEDLDARLSAVRVLREPELIDMAMQLASGLAAVHDAGVVHRDVRSGNVFLARGPDGSTQPKLLDFGGSKQLRDNFRLTTNGRRRWAAMPLYAAPEVLLAEDASFLSDQYSLGVLLFECATGVHPFHADTLRESVELITSGRPRRIADQPLQPSRRLAAVIERAMHFDSAERFADMRELASALASVRERRALWPWSASPEPVLVRAAPPAPVAKPRPAPVAPAQRSGGLGWAIGATVIACSIGAPIWAWWSVRRPRPPAAISVAAPLVPSAAAVAVSSAPSAVSLAPSAVPPPPSVCVPVPAPAVVQVPPVIITAPVSIAARDAAPAPTAPQPATPPDSAAAPALAAPPALTPAHAAQGATLPAVPPPPAPLAAADVGGEWTPAGEATPPPPTAPASDAAATDTASAAAAAPDGGAPDPEAPMDVALPALAAPTKSQERGTNGALIFD